MFSRKAGKVTKIEDDKPRIFEKSLSAAIKDAVPAYGSAVIPDAPDDGTEGEVIIGRGTRVFGSIADCRRLDVYGVLEADVVAEVVVVRVGGGIKGKVEAQSAEIHGTVEGSLVVHEHLDIRETANVLGDLVYQTLSVARGATVLGSIQAQQEKPVTDLTVQMIAANSVRNGSANGYHGDMDITIPRSSH